LLLDRDKDRAASAMLPPERSPIRPEQFTLHDLRSNGVLQRVA
jgi:hypothetical protein